jgi:1,2-phenylacetyl-CoA epoxidase PaaB subunit
MRYDVKLIHGTYETVVSVHADDEEEAIRKAKARAKRDGFYCLPMAYESASIVSTSESEDA